MYVKILERNSNLILNEETESYRLKDAEEQNNDEKEINNRHDKCFRDILSDKNEVISLLKDFVNPENTIKQQEIEPYNTSFITSKYQNREADIVYKIKGKNAFILIEHQSKIDTKMPYRLLEYYTEILRTTDEKCEKMPVVIPIIIYTGDTKWNTNGYISETQEIVDGYDEGRLDIKYNLVQANNFKTKELLSKGTMLANAMIIENSNDTEELIENLQRIIQNLNRRENLNKLRNMVKYILRGILKKEDIEKIEKMIDEKEKEDSMDELIGRIKRNDKKKMEKLEQTTMEKAIMNMAKKLKKLNIPLEQIIQVTGLSAEKIKSMK